MRYVMGALLAAALCAALAVADGQTKSATAKTDMGPRSDAGSPMSGAVKKNPKDGAVMCYVPAGEFIMGMTDEEITEMLKADAQLDREWFADATPKRTVYLDGYWMYKHEVSVAQYRKFGTETGRKMPDPPPWGWKEDHPMTRVTWDDAKAYADWAGVALPTAAQWEKAARGTDGRKCIWGDAWPPPAKFGNFADEAARTKYDELTIIEGYNDSYAETSPVGAFPAGASPYGCLDMAGNLWEWCADWYDNGYYAKAPNRNPTGPQTGEQRVTRGGSWLLDLTEYFRCARTG